MSSPRKILILSLEPSHHYPEHCRAATELVPELERALGGSDVDVTFETLPFLYGAAAEKANFRVGEHRPDFVFLLTNEPNHLEVVLHRYGTPHYNVDFPDNGGETGVEVSDDPSPACISKSEVFRLHQLWSEATAAAAQGSELAHVTMSMAGSGSVESEVFRALLLAHGDESVVISRLGVPPIAPQHPTLTPDAIVRTLELLIEGELRFHAEASAQH